METWTALEELIPGGGYLVLFLNEPPRVPPGLTLLREFRLEQMLAEAPVRVPASGRTIKALTEEDVPQMLSLTALTEPGPFRSGTIRLGGYCGIFDGDRLVAMAGLRTAVPGYREVSAVCTHPEYRGKGYGATLVHSVSESITELGEIPYLHVLGDNRSAIRLYQDLGFRVIRTFHGIVVGRSKAE